VAWASTIVSREIGPGRAAEFVAKGHRLRHFFPHRAHFLPRPGPDGFQLAERMCGVRDPAALWEIVVFADESLLGEFPGELFFDPDVVWHLQHFGRPGQVAAVDVVADGRHVWTMAHQSDLVQRIGRRRELKTRIEKRFAGWHDMLLNAVLCFALERRAKRVYVPTARLAMANTDRRRTVGPQLFERLYDRNVNRLYRARLEGDWWRLDVRANRDRVVPPRLRRDEVERGRWICVCHDVEAGLGHTGLDEDLVRRAEREWRQSVREMRRVEREAGVRATYNVVGRLLPEVRAELEADGHCLAFHSYDHRLPGDERPGDVDQLRACRRVDMRIKGYRPPQSRLTPDLSDERLLERNFEWLASGRSSLGVDEPVLRNGLVRIPIALDDFPLYTGKLGLDRWEELLLEHVAAREVAVLSLHDCYAPLWLDRYPALLDRLAGLGTFRTLDEVAAEAALAAGV
jgi:peptidoglycan/xylan/chitin deacetylase (PgdA/CDA1 family)